MTKLQLIEDTQERLIYKMSAWSMMGQMTLCIFISAAVAASLTLFLRHHIGILAYILIALPGLFCVVCGFFGCANARSFTFYFDRTRGEFVAKAGSATLVRPFGQILLVHIERELGSGGAFSGDGAPTFAVALLFNDNTRFRLEAGVSITGSGRGPDALHEQAEKMRAFLQLPQMGVPVLNVSRKIEETESEEEKDAWLSRWLSCQGLAPRPSPPLCEYDWLEPPQGIMLPPPRQRPPGMPPSYGGPQVPMYSPQQFGGSPTVVGRVMQQPQPQPRAVQVVIPDGMPGQNMTVMTPDGTQLMIQVPADMRAGQAMTVQY